ncbi:MAG: hypothetical protein RIC55_14600 [Pirellulaceae bacterium]
MFKRRWIGPLCICVNSVLIASHLLGQEMPLPASLTDVSFSPGLARLNEAGHVQVGYVVLKPVHKQVQETYTVMRKVPKTVEDPATGQLKTVYEDVAETRVRTLTVAQLVPEQMVYQLPTTEHSFFEIDGTAADAATLSERLKTPSPVVVLRDGKALPAEFRILFQPGTLVVAAPSGFAPMHAPPADPAPPAGEALVLPESWPPTFRLASIDQAGGLALRAPTSDDREVKGFAVMTKQIRLDDGTTKDVHEFNEVAIRQQLRASLTTLVSLDDVSGRTIEGGAMEQRHLDALKDREIPLVVSSDGKPVDPVWLKGLRPNMLLLSVPTTNLPFVPQPARAPRPDNGPPPLPPQPAGDTERGA